MDEQLKSKRDAATFLGVSEKTVERLVAAGQLPVVVLGGRRMFRHRDLRELVDRSVVVRDGIE